MNLRLIREPSLSGATMGVLFVDGHFEAFCLEDEIREIPRRPVHDWKIPGQTAIPQGRYEVVITPSVRFKRQLPLLLDVPGFDGVRIHAGNGMLDTEGCVLVGRSRRPAFVGESRVALEALFEKIDRATKGGRVFITIENPVA
jgi:hypothetical protein